MSLGLKLNLALLAFMLLLGAATAGIILFGFSRTQTSATTKSREALEELGKQNLQVIASDQGAFGVMQLQWASDAGQSAARYMVEFKHQGGNLAPEGAPTASARGYLYNPDPARRSDIAVPESVGLTPEAMADIRDSAALDALAPSIFNNYAGRLRGSEYDAIAFFYLSVNLVTRFYPPVGFQDLVAEGIDPRPLLERMGPGVNTTRETYWTAPYEDSTGAGLVMTAYVPVYDGDSYLGILGIDLSFTKLIAEIDSIKVTPGGFAFYIDRLGNLLHSDSYDFIQPEIDAGNQSVVDLVAAMRADENDIRRITLGGRDYFIGYAQLPSVRGALAVAAPVDEITALASGTNSSIVSGGQRTLLGTIVAMGALFVAGLIAASWFNRRLLLKPIEALVTGTRSVATGDLDTRLDVTGRDEMAVLASSFNQMTDDIRLRRDALQEEVVEREKAQDELRALFSAMESRVEERTRELRTLLEISNNVASTLDLTALLGLMIGDVKTVVDYSRCSVFLADGDELIVFNSQTNGGAPSAALQSVRVSTTDIQPIWDLISHKQPCIIEDVRGDSAAAKAFRNASGDLLETAMSDTRSWMALPLVSKERIIGMLTVSHYRPGAFSAHHAEVLGAIAVQASIAIENARLYEQAQQFAAVQERQRLARELHDSVSQALYGIALGARTARTLLDRNPPAAVQPVEYVLSLAEAGLAEMRALIFELRPESLELEGLAAALDKQVAATQARYGIAVEADFEQEPQLTLAEKEAFFRVGQEALHNIVKHSHASKAGMTLTSSEGTVSLEVWDNGVGFDVAESHPGHIGIVSMAERAASIGADLQMLSGPNEGTKLRLTLQRSPGNGAREGASA